MPKLTELTKLNEINEITGSNVPNPIKRLMNIGILAHVDAGKTTLLEQLLYKAGVVRKPGSVDKGDTQSDSMEIERRRGISVASSEAVLTHGGLTINIIDTPGHLDFAGEVQRALSVLDCAVLIVSAAEGVQAQTELYFQAVSEIKLPLVVFVNKIDRAGADTRLPEILSEMKQTFGRGLIPLNKALCAGSKDASVCARDFDEDDLYTMGEADEDFGERILNGDMPGGAETRAIIRRLCGEGRVYPLCFGSAQNGVGVDELLSAVCDYMPEAVNRAELSGIVYKIRHDRELGKLAHVRLFGGELRNRDMITLLGGDGIERAKEKLSFIRKINGRKRQDSPVLCGGDIGVLAGLSSAKVGDWIGERLYAGRRAFAVPLLQVKAECADNDVPALVRAVSELNDEEPLLDYEWAADEKELLIKVMGTIQLEILGFLIKERYGIDVSFSPPTVIYKETPAKAGIGFDAFTMPKPCWAVIKLLIEPLPRGGGYKFSADVPHNKMFYKYQRHVELSVPGALRQGNFGWEVIDLSISLIDGEHHTIHTHPMDFFLATPMAVADGLRNTGTLLLEPFLRLRIQADADLSGKILGDIINMRGEYDAPVTNGGKFMTEAFVPAAASMDYPLRLAQLSGGKALLKTAFHGYRPVSPELGRAAKRRGVDPLDRAKWIIWHRSAKTAADFS